MIFKEEKLGLFHLNYSSSNSFNNANTIQVDLDVHFWLSCYKYNESFIMALIQIMCVALGL